jgi:hypothetical protein
MRRHPYTLLITACLLLQACNQPFHPDGAYNGRLAVYAILSSSTDTQYVRVTRTYESTPSGDVPDATVEIDPGNGKPAVHFRDTTIVHVDPAGVPGIYVVYVAYNFRPQSNVSYMLKASSPTGGSAQGTTTALGAANTELLNPLALTSSPDSIVLSADFGTSTGAYVFHLYVEYQLTLNGSTTLQKAEVPTVSTRDVSGNLTFQYPVFARVPDLSTNNGFATATAWFPKLLFLQTQTGVLQSNPPGSVHITGVQYTMTQIDDALYDYYYVLNGPKDLSTIRLDAPDFTNITNGLGIIASTQTITREVPLGQ